MLKDSVALPKIPVDIEIETLYEMDGEEIVGTLGYYCCGHYESQSFIDAVVEESGTDVELSVLGVQYEYWKKCPSMENEDVFLFFKCSAYDPESFPVTFID